MTSCSSGRRRQLIRPLPPGRLLNLKSKLKRFRNSKPFHWRSAAAVRTRNGSNSPNCSRMFSLRHESREVFKSLRLHTETSHRLRLFRHRARSWLSLPNTVTP
jgi:hypothetical protein